MGFEKVLSAVDEVVVLEIVVLKVVVLELLTLTLFVVVLVIFEVSDVANGVDDVVEVVREEGVRLAVGDDIVAAVVVLPAQLPGKQW